MLNTIWLIFLLLALLVGGFTGRLPAMTNGAFETAKVAVMEIALPLIGLWGIWLGIMRLAERSGLVQLLARGLRPLMRRLFPEVPSEHPAVGAMVLNMAANMLGLGNAATPLGLRAMAHLERLNPHPGTATNAMCTFLALNTASIQIIPTTAIAILAVAGASNPTAIVPAAFLATLIAAASGVLSAKLLERLPIFRIRPAETSASTAAAALPVEPEPEEPALPAVSRRGRIVLAFFGLAFVAIFFLLVFPELAAYLPWPVRPLSVDAGGTSLGAGAIVGAAAQMAKPGLGLRVLSAISVLAVPFLLTFFPLYAACRKVRVYEQFVEGAKEAFPTAQRVIPFLVAMLMAISLLRHSGVVDIVTDLLRPVLNILRFPADLLPLVLMRPLSGSATQGIFVDLVKNETLVPLGLGADSLLSRMAATIYGSTETTFYVLAVYFGAVAIRHSRHAIAAGLIADTVAVAASITLCNLMFS